MDGRAFLVSFLVLVPASPEAAYLTEGPFVEGNLAVYLVRGEQTDRRSYLTLDEGLSSGKIVLRERGNGSEAEVNTLEVENASDDWVFLHVGDIIRGGKQDRTLGADVVLPPRAPFQAIDAFCVEPGRWSGAGGGAVFEANPAVASGRELKLSIQKERDQHRVWAAVAELESAAADVAGAVPSRTGTYNAIVEDEALRGRRKGYLESLLPRIAAYDDALGIVVSIGGTIVGADIYASHSLFRKLAPKLLDSYAQEAVLTTAGTPAPPPTRESIAAFLAKRASAPPVVESLSPTMSRETRESEDALLFEYRFQDERSPLHASYVKRK
jgi:hypothetical protein